ncbi:hypothetical protein, partial [Actinomadura sp. 7K507]|uniref:hypothetical protein n=1 Tax=Actinomadura sp. 7K507 TaxID=2530365 RepID=UPI001042E3E4
MTASTPQDRDELLITGIPPVTNSESETPRATQPELRPETPPGTRTQTKAVFVDSTGCRARLGRRLGLAAGVVLTVFLGTLGLGMTTGPSVPLTSWSERSPHPRVEPSRPDVPAQRSRERHAATKPEPTRRAAANPEPSERSGPPSASPSATAPPAAARLVGSG